MRILSIIIAVLITALALLSCFEIEDDELRELLDEANPFRSGEYNGSVTLSGQMSGDYGLHMVVFSGDNSRHSPDSVQYGMRLSAMDDTGQHGTFTFEIWMDILDDEPAINNLREGVYPLIQHTGHSDNSVAGAGILEHVGGLNFNSFLWNIDGELELTRVTADSLYGSFELKAYRSASSEEYIEATNGEFAVDLVLDHITEDYEPGSPTGDPDD